MRIIFCRYLFTVLFGLFVGYDAQADKTAEPNYVMYGNGKQEVRTEVVNWNQKNFTDEMNKKIIPGMLALYQKAMRENIPAVWNIMNQCKKQDAGYANALDKKLKEIRGGVGHLSGLPKTSPHSLAERKQTSVSVKQNCEDLEMLCVRITQNTRRGQVTFPNGMLFKLSWNFKNNREKIEKELGETIRSFGERVDPKVNSEGHDVVECLRRTKEKVGLLLQDSVK